MLKIFFIIFSLIFSFSAQSQVHPDLDIIIDAENHDFAILEEGQIEFNIEIPITEIRDFKIILENRDHFADIESIQFPENIEQNCSCENRDDYFNFSNQQELCFQNDPSQEENQNLLDPENFEINFGTIINCSDDLLSFEIISNMIIPTGTEAGTYLHLAKISGIDSENESFGISSFEFFEIIKPNLDLFLFSDLAADLTTFIGDQITFHILITNTGDGNAFEISPLSVLFPLGLGNFQLQSALYNEIDIFDSIEINSEDNETFITISDPNGNPELPSLSTIHLTYEAQVLGTLILDIPGPVETLTHQIRLGSYFTGIEENAEEIIEDKTDQIILQLDSDDDGIPNRDEIPHGDSDKDGVPDYLDTDSDNNGLSDEEEYNQNSDFDEDGIPDYRDEDDDQDELLDRDELLNFNTNRLNKDSDGDGCEDGCEVFGNTTNCPYKGLGFTTDPNDADTDDGGVNDCNELDFNTDPTNPDDDLIPDADPDHDGLNNQIEFDLGTDPHHPDSDRDGLNDGFEINESQTDPLLSDSDGDGFSDQEEINANSDPNDDEDIPQVEEEEVEIIIEEDPVEETINKKEIPTPDTPAENQDEVPLDQADEDISTNSGGSSSGCQLDPNSSLDKKFLLCFLFFIILAPSLRSGLRSFSPPEKL